MSHQIVQELSHQSTWRLLGLGIITYFIYPAHYIKRQTTVINQHCPEEDRISDGFVGTIIAVSYLGLIMLFAYLFVEESHPIARMSDLIDRVGNILFIVWGFKARNRMNTILNAQKGSFDWFHGLWTFLFTPLYFNFKVNFLKERMELPVVLHD